MSGARKSRRPSPTGKDQRRGPTKGSKSTGKGPGDRLILHGRHPVTAALENGERTIHRIFALQGASEEVRTLCASQDRPLPEVEVVERETLDGLVPEGAVHQGMAVHVAPLPERAVEEIVGALIGEERAVVMILDQVTDPHNVGAILRSAAAFGAAAVIVPGRNAPGESGTLAKSASGALEVVPYVRTANLARAIEILRDAGFWFAGMDGTADQTLAEANLTGRTGLVMGAEGDGLRRLTKEMCDHIVKLPMTGRIESLNVSNAAAIALYELFRK